MQLQTTALDTVAVVLKVTAGGTSLQSEQRAGIREQLGIMTTEHKNSAVKAQAIDVKALLHANSSVDAAMEDAGAP